MKKLLSSKVKIYKNIFLNKLIPGIKRIQIHFGFKRALRSIYKVLSLTINESALLVFIHGHFDFFINYINHPYCLSILGSDCFFSAMVHGIPFLPSLLIMNKDRFQKRSKPLLLTLNCLAEETHLMGDAFSIRKNLSCSLVQKSVKKTAALKHFKEEKDLL